MKSIMDKAIKASKGVKIEDVEIIEPPKRKRGRPRKSESNQITVSNSGTEVSTPVTNEPQLICQTNDPYESSYSETNNMLRGSIIQLDMITTDVKTEIDKVKSSKTLKGKYNYISDLCSTASSLLATKLSAIKEMNNTITQCHKLEIQRFKDMKAAMAMNEQDDDKHIADLYNAYINTPISSGVSSNPIFSVNSGNTMGNMPMLMNGVSATNISDQDAGYNNYLNNITPEQNRMLLDGNPNIETVVVYDPNTGGKSFDVIDTSTGTPVGNYPRPSETLLDDTIIDFATGTASNTNIGQNWKVVVLNNEDPINNF